MIKKKAVALLHCFKIRRSVAESGRNIVGPVIQKGGRRNDPREWAVAPARFVKRTGRASAKKVNETHKTSPYKRNGRTGRLLENVQKHQDHQCLLQGRGKEKGSTGIWKEVIGSMRVCKKRDRRCEPVARARQEGQTQGGNLGGLERQDMISIKEHKIHT